MEFITIDKQYPNNCYDCWIRQNMGCRYANAEGWPNNKRADKCPVEKIVIETSSQLKGIQNGRNKR